MYLVTFTVNYTMFAETSNCVEKGQTVMISLLVFPNRTYEFSVLVENTDEEVLSKKNVMFHYNNCSIVYPYLLSLQMVVSFLM